MRGKMDCYGESHIGLLRERNEDQFLIADLKKSVVIHHTSLSYDDETELLGGSQAKLLLVADGVGGNAAGDRASSMALASVIQYLLHAMHWVFLPEDEREETFMDDLKAALAFTQERIQHAAEVVTSQQGMGTTITMAYIVWPDVYLVHAGDSRAYLCRNGKLQRLTHDQTYAQALADAGAIAPEQVAKSPLNHILFSLLGCDPAHLDPQVYKTTLSWNDSLVLCTDGLTRHLNDEQIAEVVHSGDCAKTCVHRLVTAANDAGGHDNTTVIVAKFGEPLSDNNACQAAEAIHENVAESNSPITTWTGI